MAAQLGRLRQVSQHVEDLDRAVSFYRDTLGLRLVARFPALAFFDLDGVRLILEEGGQGPGSVLYFAVSDIREARSELAGRGVEFLDEAHVIHRDTDGTFGQAGDEEWMSFFSDSEGNLLALSSQETPRTT